MPVDHGDTNFRTRSCAEWSGFFANKGIILGMATPPPDLVYLLQDVVETVFRLLFLPPLLGRKPPFFQDGEADKEL